MALSTLAGSTPAQVQSSGMQEFVDGQPFIGATQTLDLHDLQALAMQTLLAGVQNASGTITATGLQISFPAGFQYYARQIWQASGTTTINVPDASTSYLWGCSDGIVRVTTGSGAPPLPAGFDARACCLLCKAVSSGGTATITTGMQQTSRYADAVNRLVHEGPLTLDYANLIVDASAGALRIPAFAGSDPTVPSTGTFVWFRSDTFVLCISVNGTIKRSAAFT